MQQGCSNAGIFTLESDGRCKLRDGVQLHMFISQPPCGDACMLDSSAANFCNSSVYCDTPFRSSTAGSPGQQDRGRLATEHAQQLNTGQVDSNSQVPETGSCDSRSCCASPIEDSPTTNVSIDRTSQTSLDCMVSGIAVLDSHELDSHSLLQPLPHFSPAVSVATHNPQPATVATTEQSMQPCEAPSDVQPGQQQPGVLRRKPGRGDATLSMSCSDKLARWNILGVQVTCDDTYYIRDSLHSFSLCSRLRHPHNM